MRFGRYRGQPIALKTVVADKADKASTRDALVKEIRFLATIRHEHIVKFVGVCEDVPYGTGLGMILERADGSVGTLVRTLHPSAAGGATVPVNAGPATGVTVRSSAANVPSAGEVSGVAPTVPQGVQVVPHAAPLETRVEYAVHIGLAVAKALAHLHNTAMPDSDHVVVHRDIKPDNILLNIPHGTSLVQVCMAHSC